MRCATVCQKSSVPHTWQVSSLFVPLYHFQDFPSNRQGFLDSCPVGRHGGVIGVGSGIVERAQALTEPTAFGHGNATYTELLHEYLTQSWMLPSPSWRFADKRTHGGKTRIIGSGHRITVLSMPPQELC